MKTSAWSFLINIKTGKIECQEFGASDHDGDDSSQNPFLDDRPFCRADYGEFDADCVYAESDVSADHAKQLAYDLCLELANKFSNAIDLIRKAP